MAKARTQIDLNLNSVTYLWYLCNIPVAFWRERERWDGSTRHMSQKLKMVTGAWIGWWCLLKMVTGVWIGWWCLPVAGLTTRQENAASAGFCAGNKYVEVSITK